MASTVYIIFSRLMVSNVRSISSFLISFELDVTKVYERPGRERGRQVLSVQQQYSIGFALLMKVGIGRVLMYLVIVQ
jgi:hypothetical protein